MIPYTLVEWIKLGNCCCDEEDPEEADVSPLRPGGLGVLKIISNRGRGGREQVSSEFTRDKNSSSKDKGKAKSSKGKQEEEANIALIESWENTQAIMEVDRLLDERLQSKEREGMTDDGKSKTIYGIDGRMKDAFCLPSEHKNKRKQTYTTKA
ncbi:hypothetical protein Tco_1335677 [Tanacetum coccineum]